MVKRVVQAVALERMVVLGVTRVQQIKRYIHHHLDGRRIRDMEMREGPVPVHHLVAVEVQ
jgi:hypothetical protein